jgi:hypothetical protein
MTHSPPTRLEIALGSIVAAWLLLSFAFAPIAFQKPGAMAYHACSSHFRLLQVPSGTRQIARLMFRRTLAT